MDMNIVEQLLSFDAIGIIDCAVFSDGNIDEDLGQVAECFKRFINYDFGEITPDLEADNNVGLLTGGDLFGSYRISKGRLNILMMDGHYRIVFERDSEDGDR